MLQKIFPMLVALLALLPAKAQTFSMSANDVTAATGSTAVITVNLENSVEISDMQLFLSLPEGVVVPKDEYDEYQIAINPDRNPKHAPTCNYDEGMFKMAIASVTMRKIEAGTGPVAYITIQVDCSPGEYSFSFSEVHLSRITEENMAVDIPIPDFGATLTVTAPEVKRYGDNQLYAKDLTINEGENAQLLVGYNSLTDLHEYTADITLPAGVTVDNVEYYEVLTDQSYTTYWSFADGVLSLTGVQSGTAKKPKPSEAGDHLFACVSLNTSALAAGTYNITVGNQYISNEDEEEDGEHSPEAYTAVLTVTGGTSTPTEQCEAPEISVNSDGNVVVTSATEDAKIHTTITSEDIDTFHHENSEPLEMKGQYRITSYATAEGYADSEPTTAMLVWTKKSVSTDVEILEAATESVIIIYSVGENIVISGVDVNESISIYSLAGELLFMGKATENPFVVPVSLSKGTVYIVTVGADSFKYVL